MDGEEVDVIKDVDLDVAEAGCWMCEVAADGDLKGEDVV